MIWDWEFGLLTLALGIGVGFLLTWRIAPRGDRIRELEQELASARAELAAYNDKVNQHFQTSAALFEDMTERYRAVYQHMASSAQTLCAQRPPALHLDLPASPRLNQPAHTTEADTPAPTADMDTYDEDTYLGDAPHIPELTEEVAITSSPGRPPEQTPPATTH
ncbi:MAG: YhcB family protein [Gammaproteobacteria bacterium]|nr:YhcB family protein [Gammaproteobacteria bacterium]